MGRTVRLVWRPGEVEGDGTCGRGPLGGRERRFPLLGHSQEDDAVVGRPLAAHVFGEVVLPLPGAKADEENVMTIDQPRNLTAVPVTEAIEDCRRRDGKPEVIIEGGREVSGSLRFGPATVDVRPVDRPHLQRHMIRENVAGGSTLGISPFHARSGESMMPWRQFPALPSSV